jgi:hypothetical protein
MLFIRISARTLRKLVDVLGADAGELYDVMLRTNEVLHPWLKEELSAVLETLPPPASKETLDAEHNRPSGRVGRRGFR